MLPTEGANRSLPATMAHADPANLSGKADSGGNKPRFGSWRLTCPLPFVPFFSLLEFANGHHAR